MCFSTYWSDHLTLFLFHWLAVGCWKWTTSKRRSLLHVYCLRRWGSKTKLWLLNTKNSRHDSTIKNYYFMLVLVRGICFWTHVTNREGLRYHLRKLIFTLTSDKFCIWIPILKLELAMWVLLTGWETPDLKSNICPEWGHIHYFC